MTTRSPSFNIREFWSQCRTEPLKPDPTMDGYERPVPPSAKNAYSICVCTSRSETPATVARAAASWPAFVMATARSSSASSSGPWAARSRASRSRWKLSFSP
jgi:hypothetical protein